MTSSSLLYSNYPELMHIVDLISAQNPLQRKRIEAFIGRQDASYWTFAEELSRTLNSHFLRGEDRRIEAAQAYNRMCMDILREQIRFRKTGVYRQTDARIANDQVYNRPEVMQYYIVGLLLSYLFWPNHYQIFRFFRDHLSVTHIDRCLEVGAGHGLFTAEVMHHFPGLQITLVDISQTSIELAREVLAGFGLDPSAVQYLNKDYLTASLVDHYDFIILGEVLEHVNDAARLLARTRPLLQDNGTVFLSTCVNCPALDHVYHFHTIAEIRALIQGANLRIVKEMALPAEDVPQERWKEELVTINYVAILAVA